MSKSQETQDLISVAAGQSENASESQTTPLNQDDSDGVVHLNKSPDCSLPLPKLEPSENHTLMFSPPVRPGEAPQPYPSQYEDEWDSEHVCMPCSPQSMFPVEGTSGKRRIESRWDLICRTFRRSIKSSKESRWDLICRSLRRSIKSSKDLEEAILAYSSEQLDFEGLHAFINEHLKKEDQDHFFEVLLPSVIKLALDLPNICTQPIPLLERGQDHYITMTQKQIGCLLANGFFCTFPTSNLPGGYKMERAKFTYPQINFDGLFVGVRKQKKVDISSQNAEKLKCLLNYFRRITTEEPTGTVTFHRQSLRDEDLPKWHESTKKFRSAVIKSNGLIETDGQGMLQVDFADKYVGGLVIGLDACVQEEIRFLICPELIVCRLFAESLDCNEVLIITGAEQYNKYSGYNNTFKWEGDFRDSTVRDSWGRRCIPLVAMDATSYCRPSEQYRPFSIIRELNKAYCGFYANAPPENLPAVATGNWGCGVFKGNPNLKFLIQLIAAAEAGRSLLYLTWGNEKLKTELQNMYNFLTDKNLTVGDVWRLLSDFSRNISNETKLYDYIYSQFCL